MAGFLSAAKKLFPLAFPLLFGLLLWATFRYYPLSRTVWVVFLSSVAVQLYNRDRGFKDPEDLQDEILDTIVTGPPDGETLFFIHGWPDSETMWDAQVEYLSDRGYRCVTLTLPHYGGRGTPREAVRWGYDFDELAEICGRTMVASLECAEQEQCVLVIHDWGCHIGHFMQRTHQQYVSKIVAMDVGPPTTRQQSLKDLPPMLIMGFIYQYWLATAFVLSATVPIAGPLIGDAMTRLCIKCIGDRHHRSPDAQRKISAAQNYPYFWFHFIFLKEFLGLCRGFDERNQVDYKAYSLPPILYFYGADKGFKFHSEGWEAKLTKGPQHKVVALPLPSKQKGGKPSFVGHWLMLRDSTAVNETMYHWLNPVQAGH